MPLVTRQAIPPFSKIFYCVTILHVVITLVITDVRFKIFRFKIFKIFFERIFGANNIITYIGKYPRKQIRIFGIVTSYSPTSQMNN